MRREVAWAGRDPSTEASPLSLQPRPSPLVAWARNTRSRAAEATPHPGTKPQQCGGAERAQGLQEAWKGSGPTGTRACSRYSPRGRRGGAHHGLISASAGTARSEPGSVGCRANFPASMQPRRQPPPAPRSGPGNPRATAPLLALLLLLAPVVAPAGSRGAEDPGQPQDAGVPRRLLQQAARAALHFFNFRAGSPSALRVLAEVQEGRAWVSAERRTGARA